MTASATTADPRRWRALGVCLLIVGLTILNISMVNVALPSIVRELAASPSQQQWIVNAYSLTFTLVLVPAGRLADTLGLRRLVLVGLVLFGVGSLACGFSPGPWTLVAARSLQGVGSGVLLPQATTALQQLFVGHERSRAFGYFGLVNSSSAAVGPLAGGLVLVLVPGGDPWRWVFWINLPFVLAAAAGAVRLLPGGRRGVRAHVDVLGALVLGLALVLLLGALQERASLGLAGASVAVLGAAAAAIVFVRHERRTDRRGGQPLTPPGLFRHRSFSLGVVVGFLFFAGWTSVPFVLSIYLQSGQGFSPLLTGLVQLPLALGGMAASPLTTRYVDTAGRLLVVIGLGLVVVGTTGAAATVALLPGVDHLVTAWVLAPSLLCAGAGAVCVMNPNTNLTLSAVTGPDAGSASGVATVVQRIGGTAGIAAIGSVFYALTASTGYHAGAAAGLAVAAAVAGLGLVPALLDERADVEPGTAAYRRGRDEQHVVRAGLGS